MRSIFITRDNHHRLQELLTGADSNHGRDRDALQDLGGELNRAQVLPRQDVPPDVVTMHSQARVLDLDTGDQMLFKLIFPDEAGRLSVLAPLGTAILGCRAGDTFEWRVPAGVRRLKILEVVHQPEAIGPNAASVAAQ